MEMGKTLLILGVFALIGISIALFAIGMYNNLQNLSLEADNAWAKVQTTYQERFDLIPRIVQSVVAQTDAEKEVLKNIADARARYIGGTTTDQKVAAAQQLDRAVTTFFPIVLQENYPNIKFAEAFKDFRTVYEGQENRIRVERNRYNDAVTEYNKAIKTFPGNVFAGMFGFKEKQLFEAATGAEKAPDLDFGSK
ncbi:LemA family protein [Candidatus Micrarchaeota archaeon]|nr:LemA family protein [Candidatus Micrarchaeota archaeon]